MTHPSNFEPQGLVFDMDGTLIDTMPAHFVAWSAIADKYDLHFPEDRFYELGGVPTWKILEDLIAEAGHTGLDVHALAHEKEEAFVVGMDKVGILAPIVAIAEAHKGKIPMAVATGGYRRVAEPLLTRLGIRDWFDAVVTADDVTHHKPHPETFLKAAEAIGVDPTQCRAYEDTDLGLQAIVAAGMDPVDVRPVIAAANAQ